MRPLLCAMALSNKIYFKGELYMKNENITMGGREYRGGYSSEKACAEKMTMSEQFKYEQFYEQLSTMRYTKYLQELTPDPENFNSICNYGIAYVFDHYVIRSPKTYIVPEVMDTDFVEVSYILNYPEEAVVLMKKNELNQPGFRSCLSDLIDNSIDFLNRSKFTKDKKMENVNAYRKLMTIINFVNKYKNFIYGKFFTSDKVVVMTNGERYRRFFVVNLKGDQQHDIINKENIIKDNDKADFYANEFDSKIECIKAFIDRMQVEPDETAKDKAYRSYFNDWKKYLEEIQSFNLIYVLNKDDEKAAKTVDVFNSFVTTIMTNPKYFKPNFANGIFNINYFIANNKTICWTEKELEAANAITITEGESCESLARQHERNERRKRLFVFKATDNNESDDNK
jgi:hypothetical protein